MIRRAITLPLLVVVLIAACSDGDAATNGRPADDAPPATLPTGAEVTAADLPTGFSVLPYYNDIPGLLRDTGDPALAIIGALGEEPGRSVGKGFEGADEFLFQIAIAMDTEEAAVEAVRYIRALPPTAVLEFVNPGDTLFGFDEMPDPITADAGFHYVLRHGVGSAGVRNVASDLLVFAVDDVLVFLQRSIRAANLGAEGASIAVQALAEVISERIVREE